MADAGHLDEASVRQPSHDLLGPSSGDDGVTSAPDDDRMHADVVELALDGIGQHVTQGLKVAAGAAG